MSTQLFKEVIEGFYYGWVILFLQFYTLIFLIFLDNNIDNVIYHLFI